MLTASRIYNALNYFFSLPRLIPRLIPTYAALWHLLSGKWERENGVSLWAFGHLDPRFISWYEKISSDFKLRGRFGYAFDDGLGLTLADRAYNNWGTYFLFGLLGRRRFALLTFSSFLAALWWSLTPLVSFPVAGALALLCMASPLFLGTIFNKPEMLWWSLGIVATSLLLQSNYLYAGLLWSFIALANASVATLLFLFIALPATLRATHDGSFWLLAIGALPGAIKLLVRLVHMWGTGFASRMGVEQSKLPVAALAFRIPFAVFVIFFIASMGASAWQAQQISLWIMLITGAGLWWFNGRPVYFADLLSLHIGFFTLSVCSAAYSQSGAAFIFALCFAYVRPDWHGRYLGAPAQPEGASRWWYASSYPYISPTALPKPEPIISFFNSLQDYSRFIAEADGSPQRFSPMRYFWCWTETFLPERHIDNAHEIYTRFTEPELTEKLLERFSATHMSPQEMDNIANALGINHIIVYTNETCNALQSQGYELVSEVDLKLYPDFCVMFQLKHHRLKLLRHPEHRSIISNDDGTPVAFTIRRSTLSFPVESGKSYLIRYRFDIQFEATVTGRKTPVMPYAPFEDLPTQFMRVEAPDTGLCTLEFKPRYFPRKEDWQGFGRLCINRIRRHSPGTASKQE
jgi:hypothetical protein